MPSLEEFTYLHNRGKIPVITAYGDGHNQKLAVIVTKIRVLLTTQIPRVQKEVLV